MLIDIHTHLTDERYNGETEKLVKDFTDNSVGIVVDSGYSISSCEKALENANIFSSVYCTLGIHPEKPQEFSEAIERFLAENSANKKVVAIGEIGLDYHYEGYDKVRQAEVFLRQIELADKLKLPFVVHSRDASGDMYALLKEHKSLISHGFLMHCYSESAEQAKNYLDLGAYFSFGGVITFKNSHRDDVLKKIPLDRVLCETDAPYLTPEPFRGKTNYPHFVSYVYKKMAEVYGITQPELEEIVKQNAVRLFPKIIL